jgi:hypothetical protein
VVAGASGRTRTSTRSAAELDLRVAYGIIPDARAVAARHHQAMGTSTAEDDVADLAEKVDEEDAGGGAAESDAHPEADGTGR